MVGFIAEVLGSEATDTQETSTPNNSDEQTQETEQKREKEVKEILQLADQARADMRKAEQKAGGGKFGRLEDDVRQKMGEIEEIVKQNEDEFERIHQDVIQAEVSGKGLQNAEEELESMVSECQQEFQKVEELAAQSLSELEKVENGTRNSGLLDEAENSIAEIEELAQGVTELEVREAKSEEQAMQDEADFEQRFQKHQELIYTIIDALDKGKNPSTIEEEVFGNLSEEKIGQLDNDLELMIKEAEKIGKEAEKEPEKVEELLTEDREVLRLLQDYVDRHSN